MTWEESGQFAHYCGVARDDPSSTEGMVTHRVDLGIRFWWLRPPPSSRAESARHWHHRRNLRRAAPATVGGGTTQLVFGPAGNLTWHSRACSCRDRDG